MNPAAEKLLALWRKDVPRLSVEPPASRPLRPAKTLLCPDAARSIVVQFTPYRAGRVWVKVVDFHPRDNVEGLYEMERAHQLWNSLAQLGFVEFR